MKTQKHNIAKVAASAALMMFGAAIPAAPAAAQENCLDWARAFCAALTPPGGPTCVHIQVLKCEQGQGLAGGPPTADRPTKRR
jgi:hypothetical protein